MLTHSNTQIHYTHTSLHAHLRTFLFTHYSLLPDILLSHTLLTHITTHTHSRTYIQAHTLMYWHTYYYIHSCTHVMLLVLIDIHTRMLLLTYLWYCTYAIYGYIYAIYGYIYMQYIVHLCYSHTRTLFQIFEGD